MPDTDMNPWDDLFVQLEAETLGDDTKFICVLRDPETGDVSAYGPFDAFTQVCEWVDVYHGEMLALDPDGLKVVAELLPLRSPG